MNRQRVLVGMIVAVVAITLLGGFELLGDEAQGSSADLCTVALAIDQNQAADAGLNQADVDQLQSASVREYPCGDQDARATAIGKLEKVADGAGLPQESD